MNILWVKTELLHPVDKGGKIRTYNMLRELKRDHKITYLTLDDSTAGPDERAQAQEYCDELVCIPHVARPKFTLGFYLDLLVNLFSAAPYAIKKYESKALEREILNRANMGQFDVIVCDFLAPAINVRFNLPSTTILFQHNVEAMIWKRHYQVQSNPLKKAYLFVQWWKMQRFESRMCREFDHVIAVSEADRHEMQQAYSATRISDVPTGVDVQFFRPTGLQRLDAGGLVFTGSMDWLANEDGIRYFTDQIFPIVKKKIPNATVTVVGRNPNPILIELSKRDSSIIVTGRVDDVRPYIERAEIFIVPLRIGGGTRLKIFEAMAMEKAIVSTSVGAEGLPVTSGELLLADSPEAFADSVIHLLEDKSLAKQIGRRAAKTVRERFAWSNVAEQFSKICERAVREKRNRVGNQCN